MAAPITDEQFAVRDLVRRWSAGAGAPVAVREVEHGRPDAWRQVYGGVAELGLFGVAVDEQAGGAGGSVGDLCVMIEEAARALVPGPIASTALATLVISDATVLQALSTGEVTAGVALDANLRGDAGTVSGSADYVLGGQASGVLLLPVGEHVVLVEASGPV